MVSGPGANPVQQGIHPRHPREKASFYSDVLHGPVGSGEGGWALKRGRESL